MVRMKRVITGPRRQLAMEMSGPGAGWLAIVQVVVAGGPGEVSDPFEMVMVVLVFRSGVGGVCKIYVGRSCQEVGDTPYRVIGTSVESGDCCLVCCR